MAWVWIRGRVVSESCGVLRDALEITFPFDIDVTNCFLVPRFVAAVSVLLVPSLHFQLKTPLISWIEGEHSLFCGS